MLLYLKGTACQPIIFQVLSPSASHQIFKKERNTFKILVILNLSRLNYGRCHRNFFVNALTKIQILHCIGIALLEATRSPQGRTGEQMEHMEFAYFAGYLLP